MTSLEQFPSDGIVDSHHHFWDLSKFEYSWMPKGDSVLNRDYLPPDMEPLLKSNGVAQTVLVQAHTSVEESEWLLNLANSNPYIAGVVAWVNLTDPEVGSVLDRLAVHQKLKGVRHQVHDEQDDNWLLRKDVLGGLQELVRHNLAYDLLLMPQHIEPAIALAKEMPDLRLVVNHIAKPGIASGEMEPWATDLTAIASIPGIYCKVSGMVTQADHHNWKAEDLKPYVDKVTGAFGFDRIMWGSDWPVCLMAASYEKVLRVALEAMSPITPEQRSKFLGGNAKEFYRLN